jgi:hypothetical protein
VEALIPMIYSRGLRCGVLGFTISLVAMRCTTERVLPIGREYVRSDGFSIRYNSGATCAVVTDRVSAGCQVVVERHSRRPVGAEVVVGGAGHGMVFVRCPEVATFCSHIVKCDCSFAVADAGEFD